MVKARQIYALLFVIFQLLAAVHGSPPPVRLSKNRPHHIVLDNGLVSLELSVPGGLITRIRYGEIPNVLRRGKESNRGYWDLDATNGPDKLLGTKYRVIKEDEDQIEVSFVRKFDYNRSCSHRNCPLNIDKRFIMLRGSHGFYSYSIFERLKGWPATEIGQARVTFKLNKIFDYMAISDSRQRFMPTEADRIRGRKLDYKEAVLLTRPNDSNFKGEVDDKYQYSADIKDNKVHGWISSNNNVGFWIITPSNEFRIGGPLKQELSSHIGPTALAMFFSNHYGGSLSPVFREGESWKKVFGPVFIYLNSASQGEDPRILWEDAKQQMEEETNKWPYNFPVSEDYLYANQRGSVSGRLLVRDRYVSESPTDASFAYVGLANPGEVRSWQHENKGYQFWTNADADGNFEIENVRPGTYNLYAWVHGVIGDYRYEADIVVGEGNYTNLGDVIFDPPRHGPTLWEIGVPDRTAAEFFVPDPSPDRQNYFFKDIHEHKFRQYGLWNRYTDLYPEKDLTYTVGVSRHEKDWFYAHVTRRRNNTVLPTTWSIVFDLDSVKEQTYYTLQVAIAACNQGVLEVRVNDPYGWPHFRTGRIGMDNAIARHGIHGLYKLYTIEIASRQLLQGRNTLYLTQPKANDPLTGLMYDYIRFEGPPREA